MPKQLIETPANIDQYQPNLYAMINRGDMEDWQTAAQFMMADLKKIAQGKVKPIHAAGYAAATLKAVQAYLPR